MPYAVPSYFNQGASSPGKQPLGRLVSIRGLPRPSSPEAVGVACTNTNLQVNQHSCSFPLAESGTRREYRQDLSTRKLMSWLSFDGFWQVCLTCSALGYRALGAGPWRSAGQGIRRLSPFCPAAVSDPQLPFSVSSLQDLRVTGTRASLSWTCNKNFRAFFSLHRTLKSLSPTALPTVGQQPSMHRSMLALVLAPRKHKHNWLEHKNIKYLHASVIAAMLF